MKFVVFIIYWVIMDISGQILLKKNVFIVLSSVY